MRSRAARRRTPAWRAALLALVALLASSAQAQGAGTVVSGTNEDGTPLVIDPSASPQVNQLYAGMPRVFFIQSMPTTKTVTSVTLGDLGVDAGACGENGTATVRVAVREHPTGDLDVHESFTSATAGQTLTTTPRRVTWTIPQKTFQAGRGYSFQLWKDAGCSTLTQRTWSHVRANGDALSQVNSGPALCTSGPPTGTTGATSSRRMWHVAGVNDRRPGCVPESGGPFRPEIGGGWLVSKYFSTWDLVHAWSITKTWAEEHACDAGSGTTYTTYGAVPVYGYEEWRFFCRWPQFAPPGSTVDRGWYYAIPLSAGNVRDMYLRLGPAVQDNAATFRPHLLFDNDETYRPIDVAQFQQEIFPGGATHMACSSPGWCWPFNDDGDFDVASYIDIEGEGDADNYHTPAGVCMQDGLRECDTGAISSLYYRETSLPALTKHYLDYWVFYRYNDWQGAAGGDHEGDWESVTLVKPHGAAETFDYASFSQHGTWYSYLRGNTRCDLGGSGSCGTTTEPKGRRIDTYVADGSHANFPIPCSAGMSCDVPVEAGHDGQDQWGNDDLRSALKPLPALYENWPGKWGREGGPDSPGVGANGAHLDAPWSSECAANNEGCKPKLLKGKPGLVSASARQRRDSRCDAWFGGHVRAVACVPGQLSKATRDGSMRGGGSLEFELPRLRSSRTRIDAADSAPGVAQTIGAPLVPGSTLRLKGRAPKGTTMLVRALAGNRLLEAEFTSLGLRRRGRATIVVGSSKGRPTLRLIQPGGARVKPAQQRLLRIR